ncbi:Outer membrane protein assembly factor BamB, contains PQQ-like beta-propeller repeat [Singulisphaera sp. GP187]|uniref:outer membrane protein assembly factor BamB family protein n=1 Tax=Singulisphaera sp. GP187 TaxID=1882752 RepID=UPI00092C2D26|nr:PQQ-binding-like beta-propeller repeat protein [Singulisphaera sp. GP187]SIO67289.1 Outer membrane protein assembly factor BamB, contains PQQ-like beta-propeller repeat [Singulisphaera sp. GP187]
MTKSRPDRAGRFPLAIIACLFPLLAPSPTLAQGPNRTATKFYPDFSDTADALLRNASSHVRDGQWGEAIDIYQRVIQQYGDKVAKLPKDDAASDRTGESVLYVDLRHFCQRRLATLPAEALAIYRRRVDAQAERWYRLGRDERDRGSLRRIVEQAFCSTWGDDALDMLGDLAFQDGRFEEAIALYKQLVPDPTDDRSGLIYPDPSVDLARVAAKKVLCRAALGEAAPDQAALEAYAKSYPDASGSLAGRTGPYLKTLAAALRSDQLAPPTQPDGRWPTFAGSPTRTKVMPGAIDVGSLQWRVPLPTFEATRRSPMNPFGSPVGMGGAIKVAEDRLLSYHPIVLGDQVIVGTENKVLAYNLNDRPEATAGTAALTVNPVWEAPPENQETSPIALTPSSTVPRFTLTTFGDRIYARLGPATPVFQGRGVPPSSSRIVALDRKTEGKVLWSAMASEVEIPRRPADGTNRTGFEGTPVADARNVYVAMTDRREQTSTYVACLDAESGRTRWVRYLGAASADGDNMMPFGGGGMGFGMASMSHDFGHRLLTLDGPTIYYQTNLGAVVALDAETGGICWVATYPRQDLAEGGAKNERDLNPAIVHDGLVIVAPDDSVCIYAFDAGSGRLVWKSEALPSGVKLAHLLGVAKGRLIATGDRVLLFDVKTGKLINTWPDSGHSYEGYGRGVLAGDRIYWPTKNEIHILDQASGLRADPSIKLQASYQTSGGNLAVGDGYLIVAQTDALVAFCQNSRLIQRYRDAIARAPDQAGNYFRLAQAAEATNQDELAIESFAMTLSKARPSESIDGLALADATRDHQYRLLMKLGKKAAATKAWDQGATRFGAAAQAARLDRDRLAARLSLADVEVARGMPRDAVKILQELLEEEPMRLLNLAADDGHRTIRADLLLGDRLATLIRDHGRSLYADYDEAARDLLEKGREQKSPRLLEEVGRSYPVAEVAPDALLALGRLCDAIQRPADAAHAYKRLLANSPSDEFRARALWGLARAYETQRLWVPSRDAYVEAMTRFGNLRIDEVGAVSRLGDLVSERLAREPFARMTADRAEPSLPIPLVRRWGRTLTGPARPLSAHGVPPSAIANRIFLVQGTELASVDPNSGASLWAADLEGVPVWVGYLADKVVAATETRLVALSLEKGTTEWTHELSGVPQGRIGANPFAKAEADANPEDNATALLHGFQIVGDRLFCFRGTHKLLKEGETLELRALDGDTGLIDWSYAPGTGRINPLALIGPQQIVLQILKPNAILVLETEGGQRKAEFPHAGREGWLRTPLPVDDDHIAVVSDRRTIALFDLRKGRDSWVFRESDTLPKNGSPRLLGNAESLLVIHEGTELIRLDPATGVKRWSHPLGAEDLSERLDATIVDGQRFYWASDRTLNALSLKDGLPIWSSHLTGADSGWSLALTERCVLAFPLFPTSTPGEGEGLPLVFRRRDTGTLVQRMLFPMTASDVTIRLAPNGAMVATREGFWALGARQ